MSMEAEGGESAINLRTEMDLGEQYCLFPKPVNSEKNSITRENGNYNNK